MTVAAFDVVAVPPAGPDHGVSGDAIILRGFRSEPIVRARSITLDTVATETCARINQVAARAERLNWDGDGALPVEAATVEYATQLALGLPGLLPPPDVSADRDGDLTFEWEKTPRWIFAVSVRRDGVLHYAGFFGPNTIHGSEVLFSDLPSALLQNLRRFHAGQ